MCDNINCPLAEMNFNAETPLEELQNEIAFLRQQIEDLQANQYGIVEDLELLQNKYAL